MSAFTKPAERMGVGGEAAAHRRADRHGDAAECSRWRQAAVAASGAVRDGRSAAAGGVVLVEAYDIGAGNSPRLVNVSARNIAFDAIAFRLGHLQPSLPPRVDVMFTLEVNEYNGRSSLQLNVKDIKATGVPD